jgi:hypothetical protein
MCPLTFISVLDCAKQTYYIEVTLHKKVNALQMLKNPTFVHFNSALQMVQISITPGSFTRTIRPISSPIPAARLALRARLRSVLLDPGILVSGIRL